MKWRKKEKRIQWNRIKPRFRKMPHKMRNRNQLNNKLKQTTRKTISCKIVILRFMTLERRMSM